MEFMAYVYFGYSFISLYFLFLFSLLYIYGRKEVYTTPPVTKKYSVSVVVPCYNESKSIAKTIENLVKNGYSNLKKIIVVDDCSTDNSAEIVKKYVKKYPGLVRMVKTPKNTGNAAGAKNYGAKFVNTDLIAFTDGDSFPRPGAIEKMVGYFDDPKMGVVTASILTQNRKGFLLQLQNIEYIIIKFSRKLMEFIDSIWVTPGPLVIYRKKAFDEIKGFDENNLTEDLEITWNIISHGYKVKMNVPARVYTIAPEDWKTWFKQRIRWNVGGLQAVVKYRKEFFRNGMLGYFLMPMFVLYWFISLFGLAILIYRGWNFVLSQFFKVSYSVEGSAALVMFDQLSFNPNILFFFGIVLLGFSTLFTLVGYFDHKEEKGFKKPGFFVLATYMVVYLALYPFILIASIYKLIWGKLTWQ